MSSPYLELKSVTVKAKGEVVLRELNLVVTENEIMTLVGPVGCGAEGLIRFIARPQNFGVIQGEVKWHQPCRLGFVSNQLGFFDELSVFDNLSLALRFIGIRSHTHLGEAIEKVLRRVNFWPEVKPFLHQPVKELSLFHKVKMNLARSLLFKPDFLILHDPTQFLGPIQIIEYENIIQRMKPKVSSLWFTTDLEQAARASDSIAVMKEGRLLEFGLAEDIFTTPKLLETEQFVTRRIHV